MEAFKVQSTMEMRDLVSPRLLEISREFEKLDRWTNRINKSLRDVGKNSSGFRQMASATRALNKEMLLAEKQSATIGKAMQAMGTTNAASTIKGMHGEFQRARTSAGELNIELKGVTAEVPGLQSATRAIERMATHLGTASVRASSLSSHLRAIVLTGGSLPNIPNMGGGRGGRGGGGGGGGGGHAGGLHGGNIHVGAGGVGMGSVGIGMAGDVLPVAVAGYVAANAAGAAFGAGRDYEMAFMRFKSLNLGDKINDEADKFVKAGRHFGVSNTQMMQMLSESVGLFGDFEEAKRFAPRIAELAVANQAVFGDKLGPMDEHATQGLLKFIDRRGGFKDNATFQKQMDLAEQLVTGSGGRIKFEDLDQFSQRGGTAFRGLSDDGVRRMAGLIIEQGGSAAGVGLMSMYQNLVAGRTPKKTMALLQQLQIGQLTMQEHGQVGGKPFKSMVLTNIKNADELQANPPLWMVDTLLPAIDVFQKANNIPQTDQNTLRIVNDVLSNRTGSNQASIMTTQDLQLLRDYKLNKDAMDAARVTSMFEKSAAGAQQNFNAAWDSFKSVYSDTLLPNATKMLNAGTDLMKSLQNVHEASGFKETLRTMWDEWNRPFDQAPRGKAALGSPVAPRTETTASTPVILHLDGKKVAESTLKYVTRGSSAPLGSGFFDPGLGMPLNIQNR